MIAASDTLSFNDFHPLRRYCAVFIDLLTEYFLFSAAWLGLIGHQADGQAGATPPVYVRIYTETHRLGKLSVNHKGK